MTQTFTTNANNDIFINDQGNLDISTGLNGVLQACQTAAKAQLGEMIYATTSGVPNFQTLWNGSPNIQQWEAALTNVLESVTGVSNVLSLDVSVNNNAVSYTATILTMYGEGALNGNF